MACVCALREAPFALTSDSEYVSALADGALGVDEDDLDDDDDPVAFALEAAQDEATRLLDSFGEGVFLLGDEDEDDGDDEAGIRVEDGAVSDVLAAMVPSDGEVLLGVHGSREGTPSPSYKETAAAVEQAASVESIESSIDPVDVESDDSGADERGLERNDNEVFEVEFKPKAEEAPVFSGSEKEGILVKVTIDAEAGADDDSEDEEIEEAVAVVVVNALYEADPALGTNTCEPQPPGDPLLSSEHSPSTGNTDHELIASAVTVQEIVLEFATAAEQIVSALRQGHYPHVPVAFSRARVKSRAKVDACVTAVTDPMGDAILILQEYFTVAKAESSAGLESVLVHLKTLYEYLERSASNWIQLTRSAYRQVSQWCWEVWSTHETVRILGRNVFGLALLLPCGLLFSSLYRVVAAVPEFLCAYFLTFDEVTRAQLKIFSVVLLMVLVYHARVLAWFWILLSAALGYYYWSGHVVISVKFK